VLYQLSYTRVGLTIPKKDSQNKGVFGPETRPLTVPRSSIY
jgi:hypothetical protein